MKSIVALVIFGLLLSLGITSHARTPDGMTPSEETVCDGQVGAAYGLCTAYCEAMDCDSEYPKASENACAKVEANYMNKTGMVPPCIDLCADVTCPEGETCVDGECFCGEEPTCGQLEMCEEGQCIDPCAELAAEAECPCNYSDVPMTEACWIQFGDPEFNSCDIDTCLSEVVDDTCEISGTGPENNAVELEAVHRVIETNLFCQIDDFRFCGGPIGLIMTGLSESEFLTCLCRIEQYANELEGVAGIDINSGAPPFSCSACGDGDLNPFEACDDGNTESGDGCSADCSTVEDGFVCPVPGEPCIQTVCGDGITDPGEECDDGNNISGDGCSPNCLLE